mmetsp:Transcript_7195/g.17895  ORF Transcript_7195/g.17895 Transcript_7195/m.17895 type:complete len:211 (-) Transcript_7195:570-1202(-)
MFSSFSVELSASVASTHSKLFCMCIWSKESSTLSSHFDSNTFGSSHLVSNTSDELKQSLSPKSKANGSFDMPDKTASAWADADASTSLEASSSVTLLAKSSFRTSNSSTVSNTSVVSNLSSLDSMLPSNFLFSDTSKLSSSSNSAPLLLSVTIVNVDFMKFLSFGFIFIFCDINIIPFLARPTGILSPASPLTPTSSTPKRPTISFNSTS